MAKYKVVKKGFDNENPVSPMVLLSQAERTRVGVDKGEPVRVRKGRKKSIAIVQLQFRQFVGKSKVCTLNSKLAEKLNADVDDKVEIDKELTESEYAEFQKEVAREMREHIVEQMRNNPMAIAIGQFNE